MTKPGLLIITLCLGESLGIIGIYFIRSFIGDIVDLRSNNNWNEGM